MTEAPIPFQPVTVARWWQCSLCPADVIPGRAVVDCGTWRTGRDGVLRRTGDGFTVDVKHCIPFAHAFIATAGKAAELGLLPETNARLLERRRSRARPTDQMMLDTSMTTRAAS
jgi:hypothetical protein